MTEWSYKYGTILIRVHTIGLKSILTIYVRFKQLLNECCYLSSCTLSCSNAMIDGDGFFVVVVTMTVAVWVDSA